MADADVFPVEHLLPRRETQALSFMTREPRYDGRGVLIAILDTGVDPAANGLQVTTTGEPKLVDIYDATGAGDVDTSTVVTARAGTTILGLSGRQLRIPAHWSIANDRVHVGLKSGAEIFPRALCERVYSEWKAANWDDAQRAAQVEAAQRAETVDSGANAQCGGSLTERWTREEAQASSECLKELERQRRMFAGEGAALGAYDCIVFLDAQTHAWRACVDTTMVGELDRAPLLGSYRERREWAHFGTLDRLTFGVNIHDEGKLLEIVANCGAHATHVAAICAAHFPGGPQEQERDGVAPGAQLVSIKIGDTRIGSMETGQALLRAISKAVELRCDLINYSYGEAAHLANYGRICEAIDDAVNKHRITFVSSAGNNGPALSTLGAPGGTSEASIGVGAVVHPPTAAAAYAAVQSASSESNLPPNTCIPFTWSSRGPTTDGYNGPSICAPGAAVTSVPKWCLRGSQLMNGTSMASPNACGAIALLLSALKQNGLAYSPWHVRHAIECSARLPQAISHHFDAFAFGNGILQVERAWQWLSTHHYQGKHKFFFSVQCTAPTVTPPSAGGQSAAVDGGNQCDTTASLSNTNGAHSLRGIYLRELAQTRIVHDFTVTVEPRFVKEDVSNDELIALDLRIVAACDQQWVRTPRFINLTNSARAFHVLVDPRALPPGVHSTEIRFYEAARDRPADIDAAPLAADDTQWLFKVPVTVIVPEELEGSAHGTRTWTGLRLRPAELHRLFVHVPRGATFAQLRIETSSESDSGVSNKGDANGVKVLVHAVQLRALTAFRVHEHHRHSTVSLQTFRITDERTLELCIARWWADLGTAHANVSVSFRGLEPRTASAGAGGFVMLHADGPLRVDLASRIATEACQPNVVIRSLVQPLRPTASAIRTLPAYRDRLYDGRRSLALELTYTFQLAKQTEVEPNFALLSDLLYESEFDGQFWMIFDANKQLLASGDAFSDRYATKLDKGAYTLKLRVRHDRRELLERFKDAPLLLGHKLAQAQVPAFDYYELPQHYTTNGRKLPARSIGLGQSLAIYIGSLSEDKLGKLPAVATPGSYLEGSIGFVRERDRDAAATSSATTPRDAFPFKYVLTDRAECSGGSKKAEASGKKAAQKAADRRAQPSDDGAQSPSSPSSTPPPAESAESNAADDALDEQLANAIRDAKVAQLTQRAATLTGRLASQPNVTVATEYARLSAFYDELRAAYTDHLAVHSTYLEEAHGIKEAILCRVDNITLQFAESVDASLRDSVALRADLAALRTLLADVQRVATIVISQIDPLALAAYFGVRADARGANANAAAGAANSSNGADVFASNKTEMERTRSQLVDALVRLGLAQADSILFSRFVAANGETFAELKSAASVTAAELDKTMSDLLLWCEPSDAKLGELNIRHALVHEHYARACKGLLQAVQDEVQAKKTPKKAKQRVPYENVDPLLTAQARVPLNEARLLRSLRQLGWTHCVAAMERTYPLRYPPSYTLF